MNTYKYRCIDCGVIPKKGWFYMPSTEDNKDYFYCDNCVPRGCSCMRELKDGIDYDSKEAENPENYYDQLDEKGRKLPCIEYWFADNESETEQNYPIEGWEKRIKRNEEE